MPASHMRDVRGNDLRHGDIVAYIIPNYKDLVIGRVMLMHMDSVNIERLWPESDTGAIPDILYLWNKNQVVRVHRPT
jgi:hypothetical protein